MYQKKNIKVKDKPKEYVPITQTKAELLIEIGEGAKILFKSPQLVEILL